MKKILFMLFAAAAFVACDDDVTREPSPVTSPDCQQVYFSSQNEESVVLTPDQLAAGYVVNIAVARNQTELAASVPVKVLSTNEEIFTIPETIEFAAGDAVATLEVAVSTETPDGAYSFEISIDGEDYYDPYTKFDGAVTYKFGLSIEQWENLGMATIRDDFLTSLYNVPFPEWQCECWTRSTKPGYICLKNAWTSEYPYNEPGDYEEGDVWFYVDITDPNAVKIPAQNLRFCWDPADGNFCIFTMSPGTLKDGVITFPQNGLAIGLLIYTGGKAGWYANTSGKFAIAMPGYELPE